jgi:hypothetical protein
VEPSAIVARLDVVEEVHSGIVGAITIVLFLALLRY